MVRKDLFYFISLNLNKKIKEHFDFVNSDKYTQNMDLAEYRMLVKTIKALNKLIHHSFAWSLFFEDEESYTPLNNDVLITFGLDEQNIEENWYSLKTRLVQLLLSRHRGKVKLVYLYDETRRNLDENTPLERDILLPPNVIPKSEIDVNAEAYYDLIEIIDKVTGTVICHVLPWKINWEKCDSIRPRDVSLEIPKPEEIDVDEYLRGLITAYTATLSGVFTLIYLGLM